MNIKTMKQRAFATILLLSISLFSVIPTNLHTAKAATLDEMNGKINQVSKSLDAKRGEAATIQNQIDIIDGQMAQLQLQMEATQIEIDNTTAQIAELNTRIAEVEKELKVQQAILDEHMRVIYEESNTSAMEQIAGSNNFSDFVDKNEYLQTMQMEVKTTVDKIKKLKNELNTKKAELDKKKATLDEMQKGQALKAQSINNQKAAKDALLAKANADAAGLQGQLNDLYGQKAAMSVQYGEAIMGGSSGYPYGSPPPRNLIDTPDPWGYLIGECTSYAAWRRASMGKPVPRNLGNASGWASIAGGGPTVGSVIVFPYIGGYGHVAIVEAVYGNGTVLISEYNWNPYSFTTRVVNPYNYSAVFIN